MSVGCPMPAPLHIILTADERAALRRLRHEPTLSLRERDRVEMFLLSDEGWWVSRLAPFLGLLCGYHPPLAPSVGGRGVGGGTVATPEAATRLGALSPGNPGAGGPAGRGHAGLVGFGPWRRPWPRSMGSL